MIRRVATFSLEVAAEGILFVPKGPTGVALLYRDLIPDCKMSRGHRGFQRNQFQSFVFSVEKKNSAPIERDDTANRSKDSLQKALLRELGNDCIIDFKQRPFPLLCLLAPSYLLLHLLI